MSDARTDSRDSTAAARFVPGAAVSGIARDVAPPAGLASEALARWRKDLEVFGPQALAANP